MKPFIIRSEEHDAFVRSVVLRYAMMHPTVLDCSAMPLYFQRELDIYDGKAYIRKLARQGYLKLGIDGSIFLTDSGRQVMNPEHLRFFDTAGPYVSFAEFLEEKERMNGEEPFEVILLTILIRKAAGMKKKKDYIGAKSVHLDVAALYKKLGIKDHAAYHYLVSLYYDVSGIELYDKLACYAEGKVKRSTAEQSYFGICVNPQIVSGLRELGCLAEAWEVDKIYRKEDLPISLLTRDSFRELANTLSTTGYDYPLWRARFAKAFRSLLSMAGQMKVSGDRAVVFKVQP